MTIGCARALDEKPMDTPTLQTGRLILRPLALSDAPAIQRHFNNWNIIQNLTSVVPWPYPDDGAETFIKLQLEKIAAQADGDQMLKLACKNYLDVFYPDGAFYRDGETPDAFWVKKAGLQALPLIKSLGAGDADKFIGRMEGLFSQSKDSLEKLRAALPPK